ncbi:MAG: SDR family oxidoreductase [Anaerolineae bacterium]|nr:SDR family oxidoreductase [Anaerolineae bacterium]
MTETILITGAGGNVGREVVLALAAPPGPATATATATVKAALLPELVTAWAPLPGVTPVAFDFLQPATFAGALAGVQRVFLLRPPALADARRHFAPFIQAARAAGVRQVVFLSLVGVDRQPFVPHYQIERLLRDSGMGWTFLRASFFMQNLNTTHRDEIRRRHELYIPAGRSRTSFIDTRDIGAVAARVLTESGHEGRAYTLTGSEALNYDQVADIFSAELGFTVRYASPSLAAFVRSQRQQGTPWGYTLIMALLYTLTRLGTASVVSPDAAQLLQRAPRTLRQYVQDYRQAWLTA